MTDTDPAAAWLRQTLTEYAASEDFAPANTVTTAQLDTMFSQPTIEVQTNNNIAFNPNDKTMRRVN